MPKKPAQKSEVNSSSTNRYEAAFNSASPDSSGNIPMSKLSIVLKHAKEEFIEEQIEQILEKMDKTHTDTMSYEEFVQFMGMIKDPKNVFEDLKYLDKKNYGFISKDEFKFLLDMVKDQYPEEKLDYIFHSTDLSNDKINYKDLVDYWAKFTLL